MLAILPVLLTIYACAVEECECGGTLEAPIPDKSFCEELRPPGMEHIEPEHSFNLYSVVTSWGVISDGSYVRVRIYGTGSYTFHGYMVQGRLDDVQLGVFVAGKNPGIALNCHFFTQNLWYYVNFTQPFIYGQAFWLPTTDYSDKIATMHTTIIKDRNTYYQFVQQLPKDPRLTTTVTTTSTLAHNTTTNTTRKTDTTFAAATTNTAFGVKAKETNTTFTTTTTNRAFGVKATGIDTTFVSTTTNTRASTYVTSDFPSVQSVASNNTRPQETTQ